MAIGTDAAGPAISPAVVTISMIVLAFVRCADMPYVRTPE